MPFQLLKQINETKTVLNIDFTHTPLDFEQHIIINNNLNKLSFIRLYRKLCATQILTIKQKKTILSDFINNNFKQVETNMCKLLEQLESQQNFEQNSVAQIANYYQECVVQFKNSFTHWLQYQLHIMNVLFFDEIMQVSVFLEECKNAKLDNIFKNVSFNEESSNCVIMAQSIIKSNYYDFINNHLYQIIKGNQEYHINFANDLPLTVLQCTLSRNNKIECLCTNGQYTRYYQTVCDKIFVVDEQMAEFFMQGCNSSKIISRQIISEKMNTKQITEVCKQIQSSIVNSNQQLITTIQHSAEQQSQLAKSIQESFNLQSKYLEQIVNKFSENNEQSRQIQEKQQQQQEQTFEILKILIDKMKRIE